MTPNPSSDLATAHLDAPSTGKLPLVMVIEDDADIMSQVGPR